MIRKQPVALHGLEPATFLKRFLAFILDTLLVGLVARTWMLFGFGMFPGNVLGVLLLVSMVLRFVYFPICHGLWGRTPGKRLMGIRVVRGSGEPMSLWPGFLREVFSWPGFVLSMTALFSVWTRLDEPGSFREYQRILSRFYFENVPRLTPALLLGGVVLYTMSLLFFWMNPDRRIPHDYVADTFVCREPKSES